MTAACMGGWCRIRASCPRYAQADRREPAERLCEPGRDGVLRLHPAADWLAGILAAAGRAAEQSDTTEATP